ncbi:MAG: OsmC family protein [Hyphomicrobiales bacterium]|nr:OsmC family protein [Hyphomicrobiales bacterium]
MSTILHTAADDIHVSDRLQSIHVKTEFLGNYQSVNHVRDLPPIYVDEPKELGGKDSGPTPLEMTLCALNSCTAMIMNILRKEMKFEITGLRLEADAMHDVRRAEMRRTGKMFSEVEPIAYHYHKVNQRVFMNTPESDERVAKFRSEVERLCPLHALLRDAKVDLTSKWIREE